MKRNEREREGVMIKGKKNFFYQVEFFVIEAQFNNSNENGILCVLSCSLMHGDDV